jgi:hypothetical protein
MPAVFAALKMGDEGFRDAGMVFGHGARRRGHAGASDIGARSPFGDKALRLPFCDFAEKLSPASREILGAMVELEIAGAAIGHTTAKAAAFLEQDSLVSCRPQALCCGEPRHTGSDDRHIPHVFASIQQLLRIGG